MSVAEWAPCEIYPKRASARKVLSGRAANVLGRFPN